MFNNIGFPELVLLGLVGLFVFGPERLPTVIRDAAKTIRTLRDMAQQATDDIKGELGPELQNLQLSDMNPRALVKKHLIDPAFLEDEIREVQDALKGTKSDVQGVIDGAKSDVQAAKLSMSKPTGPVAPASSVSAPPALTGPRIDVDAT